MGVRRYHGGAGAASGSRDDADLEFWRTLHLLRDHKRGAAGIPKAGRPPTKSSLDDAMAALEKRLKAFGIRIDDEEEERSPEALA